MEKTETVQNGHTTIIALSVHSTPEKTRNLVHEGKLSAPRRDSKPPKKPTFPTEADERADRKDRTNDDTGACKQIVELLTTKGIQNWSKTIVVKY